MALSGEPASRQPFLRAPVAVIGLILIIVCAHLARVYVFPATGTTWIYNYGFWPTRYSHAYLLAHGGNPGSLIDRAMPFVTYVFLHANYEHLLLNCIWFLAFGPIVAHRFGPLLFVLFFLLCGIGGAATHLFAYWGSDIPVIGASGAICGVMAAAFRMLPTTASEGLAPIFSVRILLWTFIWAVLNVVAGVTGFGAGGEPHLVAWDVHLGGYAVGLFLSGPFYSLAPKRLSAELPT